MVDGRTAPQPFAIGVPKGCEAGARYVRNAVDQSRTPGFHEAVHRKGRRSWTGGSTLMHKLQFEQDALRAIAEEAHRRKSGARGLRSILEEVMLDVMYEIPSLTGITECIIDEGVIVNRADPVLVKTKKAS